MRLPQDKKERTKILLLIGLGAVIVGYALVAFAAQPALKAARERKARIQLLQNDLAKAQSQIELAQKGKESNAKLLADFEAVTTNGSSVLKPRLGNYELSATEILESKAANCGLTIDHIRPLGITSVKPQEAEAGGKKKKAEPRKDPFTGYAVQVTLNCGTHDLVRLLRTLQDSNPFLCVSRLEVAAQSASPGKHAVTFEVQWPVWANLEDQSRMEQQMKDAKL